MSIIVIRPTQYVEDCPNCGATLPEYTATIKEVVAESREQPAEYAIWLHEPCPECGAEGAQ